MYIEDRMNTNNRDHLIAVFTLSRPKRRLIIGRLSMEHLFSTFLYE